MNTTGEAAFDAATLQALADLRKNPVDCFGQRIAMDRARNPLTQVMAARGPQRAPLLALRTSIDRTTTDLALDAMVRTGKASCDSEGFYTLEQEAFGP